MKNKSRILLVLSIVCSGFTAAAILNDAGAVSVFSIMGSRYGYSVIGYVIVLAVVLVVLQETIARMAVVTGSGLSDLIREKFGVRCTLAAMMVLMIANIFTAAANFSAMSEAMRMFHISRYIGIPVVVALIWIVLVRRSYKFFERVIFIFGFMFLVYAGVIVAIKPDWKYMALNAALPEIKLDFNHLTAFLSLTGALMTPYIQFYMQYYLIDKLIPVKDYAYEKIVICMGSIIAVIFDLFIIICSFEVVGRRNIVMDNVFEMAQTISPLGYISYDAFAIVLFVSSILACFIVPFCTAFSICEAFGFAKGEESRIDGAPVFYGIFLFVVFISSIIAIIPGVNFIHITITSQIVSAVLCPIIFIFIIKIASDRDIMGNRINAGITNIILYLFVALIIAVVLISILMKFL